MNASHDR